jgi:8-oxo-dGTP diphosphatase
MKILAGALLYNAKGEVLLQHRDDKPDIAHPGLWSLFGGSVDEGETVEAAVVREVWEELEYPVNDKHLWLIARQPLDVALEKLVLHEGQGFGLFDPEVALNTLSLSPVARYTVKAFITYKAYQDDVRIHEPLGIHHSQ